MRVSLSVVVVLAAFAAGCGGKSEPLATSARPCLEKLGMYVHHRQRERLGPDRKPRLPVVDPDHPPALGVRSELPWPDDFQEYGEVSYPRDRKGANAVQILIFADEELPQRIVTAMNRARRTQVFFPTFGRLTRIGQSLVLWSSTPTARQRAGVRRCLED